MSEADATVTINADAAGLKAALAEAQDAMRATKGPGRLRVVWDYLSGALTDAKTGKAVLSIGRLSWLVWFGQATYQWQVAAQGDDPISNSQMIIGGSLLAFITGSKVKDLILARLAARAGK